MALPVIISASKAIIRLEHCNQPHSASSIHKGTVMQRGSELHHCALSPLLVPIETGASWRQALMLAGSSTSSKS